MQYSYLLISKQNFSEYCIILTYPSKIVQVFYSIQKQPLTHSLYLADPALPGKMHIRNNPAGTVHVPCSAQ